MQKKEVKTKKRAEVAVRPVGNSRGFLPELYRGRKLTQYERQWLTIARTNPFYQAWARDQLLDLLYRTE